MLKQVVLQPSLCSVGHRLDLLLPVPRGTPEKAVPAKFPLGQPVRRDYRPRESKWQPGTIEKRIGTYLYHVRVGNGVLIKRHVDQLLPGAPLSSCSRDLLLLNHITHHQFNLSSFLKIIL